jgi:nuclear pore complex protein Nup188
LRIVVLEWQKRPASRLIVDQYENEFKGNAASDFNDSVFDASTAAKPPEDSPNPEVSKTSFDTSQQRRSRLLRLYLSEKLHILKVSELLLRSHAFRSQREKGKAAVARKEVEKGSAPSSSPGGALLDALCPSNDASAFLLKAAQALQDCFERMSNGPGWASVGDDDAMITETWTETEILEMQAILQFVFDVSAIDTFIPSAAAVSRILEVLTGVDFFANFIDSVS